MQESINFDAARPCQSCEIDRCRGGVDLPEEHGEPSYSTGCTCACTLCVLRNPKTESSPYQSYETETDPSDEFEQIADISGRIADSTVPPEIGKICRIEKLVENLEHLKNRNHTLKKLLKNCECPREDPEAQISVTLVRGRKTNCPCKSDKDKKDHLRENTSSLVAAVKILQNKCRTKDGMIAALADEFRRGATLERTSRILQNLADPDLSRRADDFDRSTLWKYLTSRKEDSLNSKSRRCLDSCRKRDIFIGLLLLLLVIFPVLFRFYKCIGPKVGTAIGYSAHWTKKTVSEFRVSLPSYEIFLRIPCWLCKGVSRIIYLFSRMLNEHLLPIYLSVILNERIFVQQLCL